MTRYGLSTSTQSLGVIEDERQAINEAKQQARTLQQNVTVRASGGKTWLVWPSGVVEVQEW